MTDDEDGPYRKLPPVNWRSFVLGSLLALEVVEATIFVGGLIYNNTHVIVWALWSIVATIVLVILAVSS